MKQRTKILSLLMAIVMVLGVIVAMPLTASATVTANAFDIRYAYEFHSARATTPEQLEYLKAYHRVDYVPYAENALTLDGIIGDGEYTVENKTTTHSYATTTATLGSAMSETGNKAVTEYFAQDDTHFYIGFEMPLYSAHIPAVLEMNYRSSKGVDSNHNVSGMYSFARLQFTVSNGTCTITEGGNGGNVAVEKITDAVADVMAFTPPTEDNTTAYLEVKLNKAQFAAAFGVTDLSKFTDFGYVFRYGSTDDGKLNYLANPIPEGFYSEKTQLSGQVHSGERSKMIARNVGLVDFRYDTPNATTTITELSSAAPVVDGTIDTANYTTSKEVKSGITEYTAIYDKYLYLAFDLTDPIDAATYLRFYTGNDGGVNSATLCSYQVQFAANSTAVNYAGGRQCGAAEKVKADCSYAYWSSSTVNAAISEDGTQIEFRFSIPNMYDAANHPSTTSAMWCSYDSLLDVNNFRYTLTYDTTAGSGTVNYTPAAGAETNMFGATARARNINFDLRALYGAEIEDVRVELEGNNVNLTSANEKEVKIDGVIEETEYAVTRDTLSAYEQGSRYEEQLAVNEYFSWTDDSIYMAFKLANAKLNDEAANVTTKNVQLRLFTKDSGLAADSSGQSYDWMIELPEGYSETEGYSAYVTEDDAHNVTVEILVSKAAMAAVAGLEEIDNFRYLLYYNEYFESDTQYRPVVNGIHANSTIEPILKARLLATGYTGGVLAKSVFFTNYAFSDLTVDLEKYYDIPNVDVVVDYDNNVIWDGEITEGEYTVVNKAGNVTEYFAHDDENFYFGFDMADYVEEEGSKMIFMFSANNVGKLSEAMTQTITQTFEIEDGYPKAVNSLESMRSVYGGNVVEIVVPKADLAEYLGITVAEIKNIGYVYAYSSDAEAGYSTNVFVMEGAMAREYEVFDPDYDVEDGCYNIIDVLYSDLIVTTDAAQITMNSVEYVEMRFKAEINTVLYNELVAEYGAENVKYGIFVETDYGFDYIEAEEDLYAEYNTYFEIVAGLTVPKTELTTDITAYGYIEVITADGSEYITADNYTVRNVKYVAEQALIYGDYNNAAQQAVLEILSTGI